MKSGTICIGKTNLTPIGAIWVAVNVQGLVAVSLRDDRKVLSDELVSLYQANVESDEQRTEVYTRQIQDYLAGERESFNLSIDWSVMTPFQKKALKATIEIPRGETRTYGEIAAQVGNSKASRAVGRAEATNPIPIVIPCHRVISSDGKLHGYSGYGGLETKAWLLELEGLGG